MGNIDCACVRQYISKEPTMVIEPTLKKSVQGEEPTEQATQQATQQVTEQATEYVIEQPTARPKEIVVPLNLQRVARSFLTRNKFLAQFKLAKALASDRAQATEACRPENRFKVVTSNLRQRFRGPRVVQAETQYGKFVPAAAPADGIAVEAKPAFILDTGVIYKGEWNDRGEKHGRGKEVHPDGTWYAGGFKHNQRHGHGRLIWPNGDLQEGEFCNGEAHGRGLLRLANGGRFDGKFEHNLKTGFGQEKSAAGDSYEGEFLNGQRHGHGKLVKVTGEVFEGEFMNGHPGISHWLEKSPRETSPARNHVKYDMPNGDCYEGEMKNGKPHGRGTLHKADGAWYAGEFFNSKMHGEGEFHFKDGRVYSGSWKNGLQHGRGEMKASASSAGVAGVWASGKRR